MSLENPLNNKEEPKKNNNASKLATLGLGIIGAVSALYPQESLSQSQNQDKIKSPTETVTDYEKGNPFDSTKYQSDENYYRAVKHFDFEEIDMFDSEKIDSVFKEARIQIMSEAGRKDFEDGGEKRVEIVSYKVVKNQDGTESLWLIGELDKHSR